MHISIYLLKVIAPRNNFKNVFQKNVDRPKILSIYIILYSYNIELKL